MTTPGHLESSLLGSPLPPLPSDPESVVNLSVRVGLGLRQGGQRYPSGPARSTASFCRFLLLTKHRCPDVLGTKHSSVIVSGNTFSTSPPRYVFGELGMWHQISPRKMLPQKWENLMAQMPSLYVEIKSEPKPRVPTFSAPRFTGSSGGEDWWGGWGVCGHLLRGKSALQKMLLRRSSPGRLPGHFTTNCYILILY